MKVSIDYSGCYVEHKDFFDAMAVCMQAGGHLVGIITGDREKDPFNGEDLKKKLIDSLGFKPNFVVMWGATETIANAEQWKVAHLAEEGVHIHFDDDATRLKHWTAGQIIKVMNHDDPKKF